MICWGLHIQCWGLAILCSSLPGGFRVQTCLHGSRDYLCFFSFIIMDNKDKIYPPNSKSFPLLPSGFPCGPAGKESACNEGDLGSIPGLGRSPGEEKGNPLQYSGLENPIDCIVHGVTKESDTTEWLSLSLFLSLIWVWALKIINARSSHKGDKVSRTLSELWSLSCSEKDDQEWGRSHGRTFFSFHGGISDHFKRNVNWCFLSGSASLILEEGLYSGWKLEQQSCVHNVKPQWEVGIWGIRWATLEMGLILGNQCPWFQSALGADALLDVLDSPWVWPAFPLCAYVEKKRQKRERLSETLGRITPRVRGAGRSGRDCNESPQPWCTWARCLGTRSVRRVKCGLCFRILAYAHFRFLRVSLSLLLLSSSNLQSKVGKSTLSAWWITHPSRTTSWFMSYCSSPQLWS